MAMNGIAVLITFKRVRMNNSDAVNNMGMFEKCYTPKEKEE